MPTIREEFELLRKRISAGAASEQGDRSFQRLRVTQMDGVFDLDFYGDSFGDDYLDLLHSLARVELAPYIRSLILRGPDAGRNGTHHWDIEPLLGTEAIFEKLETFHIRLNQPTDHNRSIVGAYYSEEGSLAKLLSKAPRLREMTSPSAPNGRFFEVGERPLRLLSVDAGYDTQNFILNLAQSACFPYLYWFEWGEYNETYMQDYLTSCTPFEHYRSLFQSEAFQPVVRFVWRNPVCSQKQMEALKAIRPDLALIIVASSKKI